MQLNIPNGIFTSMFFRLFCCAPFIVMYFPFPFLLSFGIGICSFLDRYFPVMLSFDCIMSFGVPCAIIFPPCSPAPGPMSTM